MPSLNSGKKPRLHVTECKIPRSARNDKIRFCAPTTHLTCNEETCHFEPSEQSFLFKDRAHFEPRVVHPATNRLRNDNCNPAYFSGRKPIYVSNVAARTLNASMQRSTSFDGFSSKKTEACVAFLQKSMISRT